MRKVFNSLQLYPVVVYSIAYKHFLLRGMNSDDNFTLLLSVPIFFPTQTHPSAHSILLLNGKVNWKMRRYRTLVLFAVPTLYFITLNCSSVQTVWFEIDTRSCRIQWTTRMCSNKCKKIDEIDTIPREVCKRQQWTASLTRVGMIIPNDLTFSRAVLPRKLPTDQTLLNIACYLQRNGRFLLAFNRWLHAPLKKLLY